MAIDIYCCANHYVSTHLFPAAEIKQFNSGGHNPIINTS